MNVEVRCYGNLCDYVGKGSGKPFWVEIDKQMSVKKLIEKLNLPEDEVKLHIVNGKAVEKEHILQDRDRVSIFPPIAGG